MLKVYQTLLYSITYIFIGNIFFRFFSLIIFKTNFWLKYKNNKLINKQKIMIKKGYKSTLIRVNNSPSRWIASSFLCVFNRSLSSVAIFWFITSASRSVNCLIRFALRFSSRNLRLSFFFSSSKSFFLL